MEVRVLDFRDPCEECIVKPCCSKSCDMYARFFTIETFESFNREYSEDIQKEFLSHKGISIEYKKEKRRRVSK
jgi:hypothetical protein